MLCSSWEMNAQDLNSPRLSLLAEIGFLPTDKRGHLHSPLVARGKLPTIAFWNFVPAKYFSLWRWYQWVGLGGGCLPTTSALIAVGVDRAIVGLLEDKPVYPPPLAGQETSSCICLFHFHQNFVSSRKLVSILPTNLIWVAMRWGRTRTTETLVHSGINLSNCS